MKRKFIGNKIQVHPPHGPKKEFTEECALEILHKVVETELADSGWIKDGERFLQRAANLECRENFEGNCHALVIDLGKRYDGKTISELPEKLEAALIAAGALNRQQGNFNGGVKYPPGECAVLVTDKGKEAVEAVIGMQRSAMKVGNGR